MEAELSCSGIPNIGAGIRGVVYISNIGVEGWNITRSGSSISNIGAGMRGVVYISSIWVEGRDITMSGSGISNIGIGGAALGSIISRSG